MSSGFFRRMKALIRKEFLQLSRDSSSLLLGIALPIILILIIGYGISLDVKNVPIAVVLEDPSPASQDVLSFMDGSEYFSPTYVTSFKEAEQMMTDRKVNAIILNVNLGCISHVCTSWQRPHMMINASSGLMIVINGN